MRSFLIALIPLVSAFAPAQVKIHASTSKTTQLNEAVERRDAAAALAGIVASAMMAFPSSSMAAQQQQMDRNRDVSDMWQQNNPFTSKIDLNNARMADYRDYKEMYPSIAGKIASNGPYTKVSDVFDIEGLSGGDRKVLKKYEKLFTVNPPGREARERMNERKGDARFTSSVSPRDREARERMGERRGDTRVSS